MEHHFLFWFDGFLDVFFYGLFWKFWSSLFKEQKLKGDDQKTHGRGLWPRKWGQENDNESFGTPNAPTEVNNGSAKIIASRYTLRTLSNVGIANCYYKSQQNATINKPAPTAAKHNTKLRYHRWNTNKSYSHKHTINGVEPVNQRWQQRVKCTCTSPVYTSNTIIRLTIIYGKFLGDNKLVGTMD